MTILIIKEKALLNHLDKYRENRLQLLNNFEIHYSNNMLENGLESCKNP